MPITIVTEGSPQLGTGHLRRSATLARELQKQVPVTIWVLTTDETSKLAPGVAEWFDNLPLRVGPQPQFSREGLAILDLEADGHRRARAACRAASVPALALDYCDPHDLPEVTINLIDHSQAMADAYARAGRAADYHEGPAFALIRPSIQERRSAVNVEQTEQILVTMGGADPAGKSREAAMLLGARTATFVLGPLAPAVREAEIREASPTASVVRNPGNFEDLLAGADVVLTSGGGTMLEALCLGKPTVIFPQNEAERAHAAPLVAAGACVWPEELQRVLSDRDLRGGLAENAQREVDGGGVKRIAAAALSLHERVAR